MTNFGTVSRRCSLVRLACLMLITTGCRSTAQLQVWSPAEDPLAGVQRLAVAKVGGPAVVTASASEKLVALLQASPTYQTIALNQAFPVGFDAQVANRDKANRLATAREQQAQVVLATRLNLNESGGYDMGGVQVLVGDVTIKATLIYELIDVRTGRIRHRGEVDATYRGDPEGDNLGFGSKADKVRKVVDECVEKLVAKVTAQSTTIEVPLASAGWEAGSSHVRAGNDHAAAGDWAAAAQQWQQALAENPDCHSALYNLGLKHEAAHEYAAARDYFTRAQRLEDATAYAEAIARIDKSSDNFRVAMLQSGRPVRLPSLR